MGKRRWTTPEQQAWLEALIPAFVRAQQEKATGTFFEDTCDKWHEKWPTAAPSEDEIRGAEGSCERALACKRKAAESRIKFWFHNHTRGSSSGSGTRGVLKLSAPSKAMQPWQAYLNKYQNTKLKEKINDAWQQYLSEVPEGQKPAKTLFEIRNKVAQQLYEAETAEVKQEVEEHRKKMRVDKEASEPDLAEKNKSFQGSIDKLPRTLQVATESIAKQTGWNVLVLVGGPNPRLGGKITTLALHQGTTADGKTFEAFLGNDYFERKIMSKFDDFLHESFDQAECDARALNTGSKNTPEPEPITHSDSDDDDSERMDERKNKAKSRRTVSSGTPSISQRDYEREKMKRIARNTRLLLETAASPIEEIRNVDQEPTRRECEQDAESAASRNVRTQADSETASVSRDLMDDGIDVAVPGTAGSESEATQTGLGLVEPKVVSPSANNASHDAGSEDLTTQTQGTTEMAKTLSPAMAVGQPLAYDPSADLLYKSKWFAPWLAHFRQVLSTYASWQDLVTVWTQYEALNPPNGRLSTTSRPEEIHWWIKRKRDLSHLPHIENPLEFGAIWMLWWVKMQPTWRGGESLVRTLPTDADWEPILIGGSNGLFIVVMALSWWVSAIGSNGQQDLKLSMAINDVKWVLLKLVEMLSTASMDTGGKKHLREETTEEELNLKRAKTAI